MKNTLLIFALFLGFTAFSQEKPNQEITVKVLEGPADTCILWPADIEPKLLPKNVAIDNYYRTQIVKPIGEFHELKDWKLSEDLPFMHTVNGAVYSFDYLRYRGRD
jgi:hypothetical protein